MRAAYHLALAMFSMGAVAAPIMAPDASRQAGPYVSASQQYASFDKTHSITADISAKDTSQQGTILASHFSRGALIGETLPEEIDLHPIPRHETYRYAVVNDHRVIVDAASRRVVYVVR